MRKYALKFSRTHFFGNSFLYACKFWNANLRIFDSKVNVRRCEFFVQVQIFCFCHIESVKWIFLSSQEWSIKLLSIGKNNNNQPSQIIRTIIVWNGKYRLSLFWTDVEGNASDPGFIFIWVHVLTITGSLGKRGSGFRLDGVTRDGNEKLSDSDVKSSVRGLFGGQVVCGEGGLCKEEDEESELK